MEPGRTLCTSMGKISHTHEAFGPYGRPSTILHASCWSWHEVVPLLRRIAQQSQKMCAAHPFKVLNEGTRWSTGVTPLPVIVNCSNCLIVDNLIPRSQPVLHGFVGWKQMKAAHPWALVAMATLASHVLEQLLTSDLWLLCDSYLAKSWHRIHCQQSLCKYHRVSNPSSTDLKSKKLKFVFCSNGWK